LIAKIPYSYQACKARLFADHIFFSAAAPFFGAAAFLLALMRLELSFWRYDAPWNTTE